MTKEEFANLKDGQPLRLINHGQLITIDGIFCFSKLSASTSGLLFNVNSITFMDKSRSFLDRLDTYIRERNHGPIAEYGHPECHYIWKFSIPGSLDQINTI